VAPAAGLGSVWPEYAGAVEGIKDGPGGRAVIVFTAGGNPCCSRQLTFTSGAGESEEGGGYGGFGSIGCLGNPGTSSWLQALGGSVPPLL